MPTAVCDGIPTRYEVLGEGPPLLMFSPGGFNATIENWRTFSIYERLRFLEHLPRAFSCVVFDKRESGQSGGRVETLLWDLYAKQGIELLDHLGIERAHLMGGCIGCSIAIEFAVTNPDRTSSIVLYSPAGGPRYQMTQRGRFFDHASYVEQYGLAEVVTLARSGDKTFAQDPRVGPWVRTIRNDDEFAEAYAQQDAAEYLRVVASSCELLFDRETVPGPGAGELMRLQIPALVVPGRDANHATSAGWYLEECLPKSEFWDLPPDEQTEANAPARVLDFLQRSSDSPRSSAAI